MKAEIYSKDNCPYCVEAISILEKNEVDLTVYKLGVDFTREELLEKFPSAKTFPQIVLNGESIGGCDSLKKIMS